jgi:DNA-binding NarL/FixJ family response regulator
MPNSAASARPTRRLTRTTTVLQDSDIRSEVTQGQSLLIAMADVASEMYICADTVKTYLSNIYRKLKAAHHGEAVRRARQLGLIWAG